MNTIHKYQIPADKEATRLDMPEGARILSVQIQRDVPCIWALVDTKAKLMPRTFVWVKTGADMSDSADLSSVIFIETVQFWAGILVLHLFEVQ